MSITTTVRCHTSIFSYIIMFFFLQTAAIGQELNRVNVNGQEIFMNGSNVAWVDFARDIGPGTTNLTAFESIFQDVSENGGNTMRLWLHTNGTNTPEWNNGTVVGPGPGAIDDLRDILDLAQVYDVSLMLCLWSFDMLQDGQTGLNQTQRDLNRSIMEDDTKMQAYIDNSLIPMVDALKGHPAINSWEIFNEPEGMASEISHANWAHESTNMIHIQTFINRTAGAIKRTDPDALVTNGSWNFQVLSDIGSFHNYYRDDRLIDAGGDEDGTLDFYTVHFYPEHFGINTSPFHQNADHWGLDKPIVVAEFWPADTTPRNSNNTVPASELYTTLLDRGYAGALSWSYSDQNQGNWANSLQNMSSVRDQDPEAVFFSIFEGVRGQINVHPNNILSGQEATLSWTLRGQNVSGTLNGESLDNVIGTKTVAPEDTTIYELIAFNDEGVRDTSWVTLYIVPPNKFNRAQGKNAYSSSNESGHGNENPNYVTDADMNTRWSSEYTNNEWIYVDLEENFDISRVVLHWEYANGRDYNMQTSYDAVNWTTFEEVRGKSAGERTDDFDELDDVQGRYVRMRGLNRSSEWGYSIYEFEVYGMEAEHQPAHISISSFPDGYEQNPEEVLDLAVSITEGSSAVSKVEYYINDEFFETVESEPFSTTFDPASIEDDGQGNTHHFSVYAVATDDHFEVSSQTVGFSVNFPKTVTDITETKPYRFALNQNYPNPFNPTTQITYSLATDSHVQLEVFDITGQRVAMLVNERHMRGSHTVTFDASNLASGMYLYRITAGSFTQVKRMLFIK